MKTHYNWILLFVALFATGSTLCAETVSIVSPGKRVEVRVDVADSLMWSVRFDGATVFAPSALGLRFKDQAPLGASPMVVTGTKTTVINATWKNGQSKKSVYVDHCTETGIELAEKAKPSRRLTLVVRAYDDGLALRYRVPKQEGLESFVLTEELTRYAFPSDSVCWASDHRKFNTSQERHFLKLPLSQLDHESVVICPLVISSATFGVACLTEADILSWAGMQFASAEQSKTGVALLRTRLTPRRDGNGCVVARTPADSPWRVVMLGKKPVDLVNNSGIVLNVATKCQIADTSWIKPGVSSWDWWSEGNLVLDTDTFKARVDLAHAMGWQYTTLDDPWYFNSMFQRKPGLKVDTTKGCGTIDIPEALRYSKEKGIGIIVWMHYKDLIEYGIEKTFAAYEKWGIAGVKIDYMDSDCQEIVDWLLETVKLAAKYHLMVNYHGMYKPTGLERTWPNQITREGILGNEYNKFSNKVTTEHCATLPFTRFLAGPGDFTPGGFLNVQPEKFSMQKNMRTPPCKEQGTRAHALAMCLVTDSPILTICDMPEHYRNQPGADFLKNIPAVWDDTVAVDGQIGQFYLVRRRSGDKFYAAAITNESPRAMTLPLDFLKKGKQYKATIYADMPESAIDAVKIKVSTQNVSSTDTLGINMVRNGGWCIVIE